MAGPHYFVAYFVVLASLFNLILSVSTLHLETNPLNGKHLRVLAMEFSGFLTTKRNATGHVIEIDGDQLQLITTLSQMLNFSYSYLPVRMRVFDDSPIARGAISYLINDEVDLVLSLAVGTSSRFKNADFPAPWMFSPFNIMIPYPKETYNIAALFKPLSYEVWLAIVAAVVAILICLRCLLKWDQSIIAITDVDQRRVTTKIIQYVVGNLFSQGQNSLSKLLVIRIAAGAWCLGCFFIVQIYSSTLTSHLTSPNQKPIVNSFYGIADTPGVKLTVDRGLALDVILQQNLEPGHAKRLAEMLKKDPSLRCNVPADCLEKVRSGYAVYIAPPNQLKTIIYEDLKSTGTCNYSMLKEGFWTLPGFTTLRKNSPYTEAISRGILRCNDMGMNLLWRSMYAPSSTKCMTLNQSGKKPPRISIGHLSSAFVILVVGYALSLLVFLIEKILHLSCALCYRRN